MNGTLLKTRMCASFNPNDFVVDIESLNGKKQKYLPLDVRIAWFRDVYPDGLIRFSAYDTDFFKHGLIAITCNVYASKEEEQNENPLGTAQCSRAFNSETALSAAQSAALSQALKRAGFLVIIPGVVDDESLLTSEVVIENHLSRPDRESSTDSSTKTQAQGQEKESVAKVSRPETQTQSVSYETATTMHCPLPGMQNTTLGDLARNGDVKALKWLAEKYSQDPAIKTAAQAILNHMQGGQERLRAAVYAQTVQTVQNEQERHMAGMQPN